MSTNQIIIKDLSKVYDNGFEALKKINLDIKKGEIIALLGPNGAGKTTLISIICGIVTPSSGKVTVEDFDIIDDYRDCLLYTSPSPRDGLLSRMPSSA